MQINNSTENTTETDHELIERIKEGDFERSLAELTRRHTPLFVSVVNNLAKRFGNWTTAQDVLADKHFVMFNSVKKYDPNRNTKFSTFLANEAKWSFLNKCQKEKRFNRHILIPDDGQFEFVAPLEEFNSDAPTDTMTYIFRTLKQHPDKRVGDIYRLRYRSGKKNKVMPWHMVGDKMKLSAQGCINIHNKALNYIKDKLTKEGILNVK
jgi:DNA-directed RNA polymerase specialized sigma24 family protein